MDSIEKARADSILADTKGWTPERVELVKRTVVPKGIPDDEFALFIEQCKRSGLDPLLKEAFCVGRRFNFGDRDKPKWGTRYEFQPSEAGMLARAERFPDFKGIQAAAVYAEDEILVDQGAGTVTHRFNPAKRKGSLVGAWARLVRANHLPVIVWLDFQGYVQPTPLWQKIPSTMLEKCARVAALRKAYPSAFGGMYVKEEMPAEEFTEAPAIAPERPALPAPSPVVEAVLAQTEAVPVSGRIEHRAEVARVTQALGGTAEAVKAEPLGRDARPKVRFGRNKGAVIEGLPEPMLRECMAEARAALEDTEKKQWWPTYAKQLELLEAEANNPERGAQPEPGAAG
jgi:phage recombination protein Bet